MCLNKENDCSSKEFHEWCSECLDEWFTFVQQQDEEPWFEDNEDDFYWDGE